MSGQPGPRAQYLQVSSCLPDNRTIDNQGGPSNMCCLATATARSRAAQGMGMGISQNMNGENEVIKKLRGGSREVQWSVTMVRHDKRRAI